MHETVSADIKLARSQSALLCVEHHELYGFMAVAVTIALEKLAKSTQIEISCGTALLVPDHDKTTQCMHVVPRVNVKRSSWCS